MDLVIIYGDDNEDDDHYHGGHAYHNIALKGHQYLLSPTNL